VKNVFLNHVNYTNFSRPFDLIYDSNLNNSMATVSLNRVSDHKPIVYNIEPAPSQNIGE